MLQEILDFSAYKKENPRKKLSSKCPWISLVKEGVVEEKGGALMCAYEFIAPDIASSSWGKIQGICNMFNTSLVQLGNNWSVQFELQRRRTNEYPGTAFSNLAGYLIEKQRELKFSYNKNHFKNRYFLIFTYFLPSELENKVKGLVIKNKNKSVDENEAIKNFENEIRAFEAQCAKVTGILKTAMFIERLNSSELLSLLHSSVSTEWQKMAVPEDPKELLYIDNIVTSCDLENTMPLKLGDYYIPILSINAFPGQTVPAMFDIINKADCELRWSTRFCCYSKTDSYKRIEQVEKKFHGARKSFGQMVMESTLHTESTRENSASIAQEGDAAQAKIELTMGSYAYGEYTSSLMVWNEDYDQAQEDIKYLSSLITSVGFTTKEESVNSFQSFLSMQPGNIYANRRSLFCSSGNLSHVIPLSSIWAGLTDNNFMNDVCGQKHPHVICDTEYGIPFYLNLNVRDVGHSWISGRTGAGKSTLLALLEAQWLKYPGAQVIIFDKDRSARNLTICTGGQYIEPGKDEIQFQPLAEIDEPLGQQWAAEFIEMLLVEQKIVVNASMRKAIFDTIKLLATKSIESRTLTSFQQYCDYQDPNTKNNDIADGISPYVLGGMYGSLFDSEKSNLDISNWTMIEMGTLMNMAQGAVAPALDYLFRQCEKKFTGKPTLLVLDEAWIFFKNPIFAKKIVEWLKVLRKKNVFVVFATQEIDDAINSEIASTLVSQCVTKIFLADDEALTQLNREAYRKFGLEPSEIHLLSKMTKKKDYYYKSSMGTRLFQLDLDELQLGILTCSTEEHKKLDLIEEHFGKNSGEELVTEVLDSKGIDYRYLLEEYND